MEANGASDAESHHFLCGCVLFGRNVINLTLSKVEGEKCDKELQVFHILEIVSLFPFFRQLKHSHYHNIYKKDSSFFTYNFHVCFW